MAVFFTSSRPTPTTASYTVRSSRPPSTLAARTMFHFLVVVRITVGLFVLWLLRMKWKGSEYQKSCDDSAVLAVCRLQWTAQNTPWLSLLPVCLIGLWAAVRRGYVEETLLVLRGMGVQMSTSSWAYLLPPSTRFVPTTTIQDIFIHEAFKGFEVRYYFAIIVEGEEDAHVVFPTLLPRRRILEEVWRGARDCLYELKTCP